MRWMILGIGQRATTLAAMHRSLFNVEVIGKRRESSEVVVLEVSPLGGVPLPPFEPGEHIDIETPFGLRQYSLCSLYLPGAGYRVAVKLESAGRGGSRWLHDEVVVGQALRISAPRNHFGLVADASRYCLLAGGIGITPMLTLAHALASRGADFELAYFCRSRGVAAFLTELADVPWAERVRLHFDDDASSRLDLHGICVRQPTGAQIYSCGPPGFMAAVRAAVASRPSACLHEEKFAADAPLAPGGLANYEVHMRRSGVTIQVHTNQTLLNAIRAAGIDPMTSCETGVCGSCVTAVLEGTPLHGDSCLSESDRRGQMALCCGGSLSARLVLDL